MHEGAPYEEIPQREKSEIEIHAQHPQMNVTSRNICTKNKKIDECGAVQNKQEIFHHFVRNLTKHQNSINKGAEE